MANVITEDKSEPVIPPNASDIRDAILAIIPDDSNIQRDVRLQDGVAAISIKWRTLRWQVKLAIQDQTAEQMAQKVMTDFALWVRTSIKNRGNTPRYEMVINQMKAWVERNPDKASWVHA